MFTLSFIDLYSHGIVFIDVIVLNILEVYHLLYIFHWLVIGVDDVWCGVLQLTMEYEILNSQEDLVFCWDFHHETKC
jgi:hypothetical protein